MATEKAVVTQQSLTDIADAIREKSGTEETMLPSEMAAAIRVIPSGGGIEPLDIEADRAFDIGAWAFAGNPALRSFTSLSAAVNIGNYCFAFCPNLKNVILKNVSSHNNAIIRTAFIGCDLDTLEYGFAGSALSYSGNWVKSIRCFKSEKMTEIGYNAFLDVPSIRSVILPACKTIRGYAFYHCKLDQECDFSAVETIESYVFQNAFQGVEVITAEMFPSLKTIGSYSFTVNESVKEFEFSSTVEAIEDRAFTTHGVAANVMIERLYGSLPLITSISMSIIHAVPRLAYVECFANVNSITGGDLFHTSSLRVLCLGELQSATATCLSGEWNNGFETRVKNTMASIRAVENFPFGLYAGTRSKFSCRDGYITYSGGAWIDHTYTSVDELPTDHQIEDYVYDVNGKSYKWNKDNLSYEEVV